MNRAIFSILFIVSCIFTPKAHSESLPVEVQDCLMWVARKLPTVCPTTKKPAYCDSMGISLQGGKMNWFFPLYAAAIKDNACLAQKQVMFNVCVYGNFQKIPQFSNWQLFKPTDMRCGLCHKNYARTGWCY